jgi:hypothetical protein
MEQVENRLKRLDAVISNKYSTLITASSKDANINISFPTPLSLNNDYNYEMGLLWFSCYNTVFNIIEGVNNKFIVTLLFENKTIKENRFEIKLNSGAYELEEISKEITLNLNRLLLSFKHVHGIQVPEDRSVASTGGDLLKITADKKNR